MTKKSKQKNLLNVCLIGSGVVFGVLTLLLMLAPGIITKISLLEARFSVYELLNYADEFRIGVLLILIFAIVLLAAALLLAVLKLLNKKSKYEKLIAFCAAVLGIVAGVLLFLVKSLVGLANSSITSLGIGAILAGVFAIVAALSLGLYAVKAKK